MEYNVLVTPKNYNTTLGVVRTVRENLRPTHEVFVCEMGARNVGDIREICDLVEYNSAAANDELDDSVQDPWKLIWVFDGDSSTNVVCEGYAKAFKYLCDLSEFQRDISCITVSGVMSGGTGAGDHMWNVVNMGQGAS